MEKVTLCLFRKLNTSNQQNLLLSAKISEHSPVSLFLGAGVEGSSASPPERGFGWLVPLGSGCSCIHRLSPEMPSWAHSRSMVCLGSRNRAAQGERREILGLLSRSLCCGIHVQMMAQRGASHTGHESFKRTSLWEEDFACWKSYLAACRARIKPEILLLAA